MRWQRVVLVLAACALCASCTSASADRSGGSGPPTVLVLANNDESLDGAPAVTRFVERVRELSDGRVRVDVQSSWGGGYDEVGVVRAVGAGQADLGWAGTRVMDQVGVDAFRPLHAPFLVGSYAAQSAVVGDPLAGELLAELAPLGVTGLALAADQLRMPAAAARPLLTPADFAGLVFRTAASGAQESGLRALGAVPKAGRGSPGRLDGVDAVETMWWTYAINGQYGPMPYVTSNAALWPRSLAIFANTERLGGLTEQQRGWLVQAGQDASSWSTAHAQDRDAEQVKRVCRFGARVATATPDQLAALRSAAQPVYAALRADARTAAVLRRVEGLVAGAVPGPPVSLPAGCAYRPGEEQNRTPDLPALAGPGDPGTLPQGVYRLTLTRQHLLDQGVSEPEADLNAGVFTYTLRAGTWQYRQQPAVPGRATSTTTTCEGWYAVGDNTASFTTTTTYDNGTCAPLTWSARWTANGSMLTWDEVSVPDFGPIWSAGPWQRIDA